VFRDLANHQVFFLAAHREKKTQTGHY